MPTYQALINALNTENSATGKLAFTINVVDDRSPDYIRMKIDNHSVMVLPAAYFVDDENSDLEGVLDALHERPASNVAIRFKNNLIAVLPANSSMIDILVQQYGDAGVTVTPTHTPLDWVRTSTDLHGVYVMTEDKEELWPGEYFTTFIDALDYLQTLDTWEREGVMIHALVPHQKDVRRNPASAIASRRARNTQ